MNDFLNKYSNVAGEDVIQHLQQLAAPLEGIKVVHVNSTRVGGGVAEILNKMVPLMSSLGLDVQWEVITGEPDFYQCTKSFHNALQGMPVDVSLHLRNAYETTNEKTAEEYRDLLTEADVVIMHDPQPAAMLKYIPNRKGKWIWRCHIDVSRPYRPVWKYLKGFVSGYDASIFSLVNFTQVLPHPQYLIPPSIDPLSEKNMDLPISKVRSVLDEFDIDPRRPLIVQVSRFDRFKDPVGVIRAYRLTKRFIPQLQLVLAGGGATDDPEGDAVLSEVKDAAGDDPDIHVLLLPADAHATINALQRAADIVLQKSIREGFGLTVSEAMWKGKPVIGGDTGGIRLQVTNHHTGFLVSTPEGAALRIQYLLRNRETLAQMGEKARDFVRDNFLLTRQLREYLTIILGLMRGGAERMEIS